MSKYWVRLNMEHWGNCVVLGGIELKPDDEAIGFLRVYETFEEASSGDEYECVAVEDPKRET